MILTFCSISIYIASNFCTFWFALVCGGAWRACADEISRPLAFVVVQFGLGQATGRDQFVDFFCLGARAGFVLPLGLIYTPSRRHKRPESGSLLGCQRGGAQEVEEVDQVRASSLPIALVIVLQWGLIDHTS